VAFNNIGTAWADLIEASRDGIATTEPELALDLTSDPDEEG
jgi:hypothetical protein